MNTVFLRKLTVVCFFIFFASCDKDFNTIGSDVIGNENFTIKPELFTVKAYNQKIPAVETSNLIQNQLGVLANRNTVLGTTTSDFVTALTLVTLKPNFKSRVVIDSVILTIPFFSTKLSGGSSENGTYTLNGIYTTNTASSYDPIDLKVYRNGYFLANTNPSTSLPQKHYSNEGALFDANKLGSVLNDSALPSENIAFIPDAREIREAGIVDNQPGTIRSSPRIRLHLNTAEFLQDIITPATLPATSANFETAEAFKNYYKGLYFKSTQIGAKGTSMLLNFAQGNVTIFYKQDATDNDPTPIATAVREAKTLVLNMTGNTVNLFNNTNDPTYTTAVNNPNTSILSNGNKKLYLKGGEGSLGFIELFNQVEIDKLRSQQILINEASLNFTVDNSLITSDYNKAKRIYIFNADDNTPVFDYFFDNSTNSADFSLSKFIYGGILQEVASGKDKYKIRITEHVNNIIKRGARNVRLGVIVTENITAVTTNDLLQEIAAPSTGNPNKMLAKIPVATITNRFGTVLFGTDYLETEADYDYRLKFEIYYTKPN